MVKTCSKCGQEKDESEFNKDSSRKDGLQRYCRECNSSYNSKWLGKNKKHRICYKRTFAESYRNQPMPAWKNTVRQETKRLVLNGLLLHPGCCEACGLSAEETPIQIHHCSYLVPNNVLFLCHDCHTKWHKENPDPPEPEKEWVEKWYENKEAWPSVLEEDML